MQPSFIQLSTWALLLLSTAQAHMVMKLPVPYSPQPNNSPLSADGSDFPCKQGDDPQYIVETENEITIGEPQTLSFTGSAVHGGGSCQVSLTTDRSPTKDSKWMVIKSIEGGCPSNVTGNLPADANGDGAAVFEYTVPEGISPGKYTIAWSWINKVGNREFYMNCGPATISAAKKKRYVPEGVSLVRKQTDFPELFVANLDGISSCTTPEGYDYNYPSPGDSVQSAGDGPYTQLSCDGTPSGAGGNSTSATTTTADSDSTATATTATTADATTTDSASETETASATQASGGVFASGASSLASETTAASATATTAAYSAASTAVSTAAESVTETASTAAASVTEAASTTVVSSAPLATTVSAEQTPDTACSPEGAWLCLGNAFQRCASGVWSVVIDLADGTNCTTGSDQTLSIGADKRSTLPGKYVRRAVQW